MILTDKQAAQVADALKALDDMGMTHVTVHLFGSGVVEKARTGKISIVSQRGVENYSCHETFAEAYELD